MNWLVLGLFASALVVLVAAEWPRLLALFASHKRSYYSGRKVRRRRRHSHLTLVEDEDLSQLDEEREAFAESVVRDLERLPTIDDRD